MFELIKNHQLDIMLSLCAVCFTMAVLLLITRFLPRKQKWILIAMEITATLLLGFDRLAYIYSGDTSAIGYIMVRLSNFFVFFLTSAIILVFNSYLSDLLVRDAKVTSLPRRLIFSGIVSLIGMLLSVITVFTGLYYYFDEQNQYHRGFGFLICYIIPVFCPLVQFSAIYKYRHKFSRFIYTALVLYIFVPIIVGIIQIFTYGISIVNMTMVLVSVFLYIFTYLDINDDVVKAHNLEMEALKEEHKSMQRLFSQTAKALVNAQEKRSDYFQGFSQKTAEYAFMIAKEYGKTSEECDIIYYSALLHNAGCDSIPDSLIGKEENLTEEEVKILKELPLVSSDILSNIKEFPYLSQSARYINERYDGKGFPEGLKGKAIPEISRIIAVARAYVSMINKKNYVNHLTNAIIREALIKESGNSLDPVFTNILVHIIDTKINDASENTSAHKNSELNCSRYRDAITEGIPVIQNFTEITFNCSPKACENGFSAPSIIIFDSYDKQVHHNQKTIESNNYVEYGEAWFDGHIISTSARNMEVQVRENENPQTDKESYIIRSVRYEDHLLITLTSQTKVVEVTVALMNISKAAYIALTGENCLIKDIKTEVSEIQATENTIPRIAELISYINHIESDIPNVQVNSTRQEYTKGIEIKNHLKIRFHTKSLPEANLIWHCPYIVLYYSDDEKVGGENYREYALIKLNGEDNGSNDYAKNTFSLRKENTFNSWTEWKEENKSGFESVIEFSRKGNKVTLKTINLGLSIKNVTEVLDDKGRIFVALTGDRCALTDIRLVF